MLEEATIPVLPQVEAACELLGLDPLYVANEDKLIALCAPEVAVACWIGSQESNCSASVDVCVSLPQLSRPNRKSVPIDYRFMGR